MSTKIDDELKRYGGAVNDRERKAILRDVKMKCDELTKTMTIPRKKPEETKSDAPDAPKKIGAKRGPKPKGAVEVAPAAP